jgi:hypothetical protein
MDFRFSIFDLRLKGAAPRGRRAQSPVQSQIANRKSKILSPRGLTFVELVIGLCLVALVIGATGAVLAAVADGWGASDAAMAGAVGARREVAAVERVLREAKLLGVVQPGSLTSTAGDRPAVMLWRDDANADGQMQFAEVALIEFNPTEDATHGPTLRLWEVRPTTPATPAHADVVDPSYLTGASAPDDFKARVGVTWRPLASGVTAAQFAASGDDSVRPTVDFVIKQRKRDGFGQWKQYPAGTADTTDTAFGTATLRTPATRPS